MKHVPLVWLRRLHWALVGYVAVLFAGYVLLMVAGPNRYAHLSWGLIGGIVGMQVAYELVALAILRPRPWVRTSLSLAFALLETFLLLEATDVYASPFVLGVFVLIVLGTAIGEVYGAIIFSMLVLGFVLGLAGFFQTPTDIGRGLAILVTSAGLAAGSHLFWRRYYTGHIDKAVDVLHSSLSKEQAKSDIILNAIEDGAMLIDDDNIIRVFNPGASAITGWPATEALELDYHAVLRLVDEKGEPYDNGKDPLFRVFKEKKTVRDNQAALVSRSEKHILLDLSVSPLLDPDGKVSGAVCIFRDVSEKRGEEQRRAEFISTASHEMRTPVAAIEGYLALALNERVSTIDSKAREFLEKAHASTQHLGKLFQDLLTSARAEDGRLSSHPTVVEMGDYIERLVEDLKFAAEKKGLRVEMITGGGNQVIDASQGNNEGGIKIIKPLYYVLADPDRLREVITNLFDNAVKYTESGTLSIGLTGDKEVVQLYVRDTGPGIPHEDIPHLFQKFYRVDNSATRTIGGTGLGLFICRKIIELYNGRIWVESELNKGSTFFIDLPRIDTQKATQLQATQAAQNGPLTNPQTPPQ
jgi:PAS domain S-box-containing protein